MSRLKWGMTRKLHLRIMLPFIALFLVMNVLSLIMDHYAVRNLIDERIYRQADRITRLLSGSNFILSPTYLSKLKDVIEGDILVVDATGGIIGATLSADAAATVTAAIDLTAFYINPIKQPLNMVRKTITYRGESFLLTAGLLPAQGDEESQLVLLTLSPLSDVTAFRVNIGYRRLILFLSGLLLTVFFGFFIAGAVTRPVKDLVAVTEKVADGCFDQKVHLPEITELSLLAAAINRMTDKLADYEKQLVQSSRLAAAGHITAALAHEIRNPLSSIKMMIQLLRKRTEATPENQKLFSSLLEEISRLERIVTDSIQRVRPTEVNLDVQEVETVISDFLPMILPKLSHRKIRLSTHFEPNLPRALLDRDKFKQVLWNLLLNAMESMPAGGEITLHARTDTSRKTIEVMIEDEGCGIAEANKDAVFTHFFSTKPEGLGLGLPTSREIITRHNGSLIIENRDGAGTRAVISIPAFRVK